VKHLKRLVLILVLVLVFVFPEQIFSGLAGILLLLILVLLVLEVLLDVYIIVAFLYQEHKKKKGK